MDRRAFFLPLALLLAPVLEPAVLSTPATAYAQSPGPQVEKTAAAFIAWREAVLRGEDGVAPPAWFAFLLQSIRNAGAAPDPVLAAEVAQRVAREQFHQQALMQLHTLPEVFAPYAALPREAHYAFWQAINAEFLSQAHANAGWVKQRFAARGRWWPISEVGAQAHGGLWVMVQHADHDPAFQEAVLAAMEPLLEAGEVNRTFYALLWDRTARNAGRPQRYGTQFGGCVNQEWTPHPIEAPQQLDERRAAMGLEPYARYVEGFKNNCKPQ